MLSKDDEILAFHQGLDMPERQEFLLKKQPTQKRSQFMVNAIKEAATHILRLEGVEGFNTNRVAERAGASVGSLYQYFDSKEVLIAEIKRDHFKQLRELFANASLSLKTGGLKEMIDAFIEASVQAHRLDPELHRVLSQDLAGFELKERDQPTNSVLSMVRENLARVQDQLRPGLNIDIASQLVYQLVEFSVHHAIIEIREPIHIEKETEELKQVVYTYLSGQSYS